MVFVGRLPPKPCGAWPESVTLPCAFQVRVGPFGRFELLNEPLPFGRPTLLFIVVLERPPGCVAKGGRLTDNWDMRLELIFCGAFCCGRAMTRLLWAPGVSDRESIVRTGMCEAAAAGEVRAMTVRFCVAVEGMFTRPC